MSVELRPLDRRDVKPALELQVAPSQRRYVDSNAVALAHCYGDQRAQAFGIWAGEELVGMAILLRDPGRDPNPWLAHLMVDRRHQEHGYGEAGLLAIIREARAGGGKRLTLGYVCGAHSPEAFYRKHGFRQVSGEMERRL